MSRPRTPARAFPLAALIAAAVLVAAVLVAGCGTATRDRSATSAMTATAPVAGIPPALTAGLRPIGRGPRFQPPRGDTPIGSCAAPLGRRDQAHVEVFAQNRVVLLAAGIGARGPLRFRDGRLTQADCFGDAVTLDPTGTIYFRPGVTVTVAGLFAAWGQPLSADRIASFTGGPVHAYVDGRAQRGPAGKLKLFQDAEIVLEIGPYVPPHHAFTFPSPPSPALR